MPTARRNTIVHLKEGPAHRRGPKPQATYRAVTRHDARPITLGDAIRQTVGVRRVAAAIGVKEITLLNITQGSRGVRPADAELIARMVDRPLDDLFIDTTTPDYALTTRTA